MEQICAAEDFSTLEEKVSSAPVDDRNISRKATDVYFKPKAFEKSGKLYETLGVKYMQKAIMGTAGRVFRAIGIDEVSGIYFIGKKRDLRSLKKYESGTRIAELIHAPQIALDATVLTQAVSEDNYGSAVYWGGLLLLNISCTMLQRYNRARVDKVIERAESRKK